MNDRPTLGIIGGSGMYSMPGLKDVEELDLETPFGKPSSLVVVGTLEGERVAFLARHGSMHQILPSEVNYRANIYALKMLGVERVVSISACGSLREDYAPGEIVIPDQLFDFTRDRKRTFFGEGLVVHISVADPFCPDLSEMLLQATQATGATVHTGGSFIVIEGPRFSTRAESNVFRSWGMSLVGMTTAPEVFLAREAEMCYAVMAHVTDYDVWHVSEDPVTLEMVIEILNKNTQVAQAAVRNLVRGLKKERSCDCAAALANSMITLDKGVPPEKRQLFNQLMKKYQKTD